MLVLTFSCHVVGGWVGVCVRGWTNVSGVLQNVQGMVCLGIIDLLYCKLKKIRETTMSIYSNQGVS